MSKANFWNSVARGAVKGWDTGREWERQDADEEYKGKQRKLAGQIVDMLMGRDGQGGEAAPAMAAAEPAAAAMADAGGVAAQEAAPVAAPAPAAASNFDAVVHGIQGAQQQAAQQAEAAKAAPVRSAGVESYAIPSGAQVAEQVTLQQAAPQQQGVAALRSLMSAPAPQRAAAREGDENFMRALGALAVLRGDINTAAALRGRAQQEEWDAEDAAVAARMMNDPQGEEMQQLMGGILSSALPGVRARRDDKTGETSVYVTDEDGTHEVPLKGQTLMNAIRAKQMLERGQYGEAVRYMAAIDKTLAERAAQTIQTNLQNLKLQQAQQAIRNQDARLGLAYSADARAAAAHAQNMQQGALRAELLRGQLADAAQNRAWRAEDRDAAQQEAALQRIARNSNIQALIAEGRSPEEAAAIAYGQRKYAPLSAGGGSASGGGGGAWKTDPKKIAAFLGTPKKDARGRPIVDISTGEEQMEVTPETMDDYLRFKASTGYHSDDEALPRYRIRAADEKQRQAQISAIASTPQAQAILNSDLPTQEKIKRLMQMEAGQ